MRRRAAVILGVTAVVVAVTAWVAVVHVRAKAARAANARYEPVDVGTLVGLTDAGREAWDGRRVRLEGEVASSASGSSFDMSDGRHPTSHWDRTPHVRVVPLPGYSLPTAGAEVVCWGVLTAAPAGTVPDYAFTLTSDQPEGSWAGPAVGWSNLGETLAVLPYLGVLIGLALGVRRMWRLHRLRRLRPGRCPACGYDLRGTPGRCPECGRVAVGQASRG